MSREHASTPFVILIACAAALGGFLFGYDTACINGAVVADGAVRIPRFQRGLRWDDGDRLALFDSALRSMLRREARRSCCPPAPRRRRAWP